MTTGVSSSYTPSDPGVYPKFVVRRADPEAESRHQQCFVFVLDPGCDPHAAAAVGAYADSCQIDHPALARDLRVFAFPTPVPVKINAISRWIDEAQQGRDPEAVLWHRVAKVSEEAGEAIAALIGLTGANPRKQDGQTVEDLRRELLDVALSALSAHAHTEGNQGDPVAALTAHVDAVYRRAGLAETGEEADGSR